MRRETSALLLYVSDKTSDKETTDEEDITVVETQTTFVFTVQPVLKFSPHIPHPHMEVHERNQLNRTKHKC